MHLANQTLQTVRPGSTLADSTSIFKVKGTISGGTVQSMVTLTELSKEERRAGEFTLCPGGKSIPLVDDHIKLNCDSATPFDTSRADLLPSFYPSYSRSLCILFLHVCLQPNCCPPFPVSLWCVAYTTRW